jgi:tRNA pseudouridine55 synthase
MRKRVVGATVVVAAGLALSGCTSGGAAQQAPTNGGGQIGSQPIEAGQAAAPGSGTGSGSGERACEASDFDAVFNTHEVYDGGESGGQFSVTKNSNNMTPCVLDGYPGLTLMRGNEGGEVLPVTIKKETADGAKAMRFDGLGDIASFNITWTTSGDDGGCDMPGALSVTLPGDDKQDIEVPVNRGPDNSMRVCENHELTVVPFGDYTN